MTTPACSIIIRTLNEARYLGELLGMIRDQDYPQALIETIVVDSGSTDGTLEIAAKHGCRVQHVNRTEFSFGRSLNLGCEEAKAPWVVVISGHCVPVDRNWLWQLLQPLREPDVAVTYGRQVGGPASRYSELAHFNKYFPAHQPEAQVPYFCNNANLALQRGCWEKHRFDESLTGLEDMQFAKRLWERGKRIVYVPEAVVHHHHHERWTTVKRRYEREAIALQQIMPEVHVHWHDALRYFLAGVLGDWSRAMQQRVLMRKAVEIVAFRFCQFYGAWRGNHMHRTLSRRQKNRYFYPH